MCDMDGPWMDVVFSCCFHIMFFFVCSSQVFRVRQVPRTSAMAMSEKEQLRLSWMETWHEVWKAPPPNFVQFGSILSPKFSWLSELQSPEKYLKFLKSSTVPLWVERQKFKHQGNHKPSLECSEWLYAWQDTCSGLKVVRPVSRLNTCRAGFYD